MNNIYDKSMAVYRSAMERGTGLEMAENHLFAAISALTRTDERQLADDLKLKLSLLQAKLHEQINELEDAKWQPEQN